jgi:hypothetical protein
MRIGSRKKRRIQNKLENWEEKEANEDERAAGDLCLSDQ